MIKRTFISLITVCCGFSVLPQAQFVGNTVDSKTDQTLAFVNIGIRNKNIGTTSSPDGSFAITIPPEHLNDTLTFSMVGYHEMNVPLRHFNLKKKHTIRLIQKIIELHEVEVSAEKLTEKKFGIKKRGLVHFTDGIFKSNDSFEIGQVIRLGNNESQIASVNLHINSSRPDSATFRINFYRYGEHDNKPTERIIETSILQRHPIREGWLKFDLRKYNVFVRGNVFVSIEFIPEKKENVKQIYYEVKIGGSSKSYFRRSSLGQWTRPPHHYCLYATVLVDKSVPDEPDDVEAIPAVTLSSGFSKEPFSIFVRLPKDYNKSAPKKYPVIYHVDGNAFFDAIGTSVDMLHKRKRIKDAIVVGIGYENVYVMDSLRSRDYTFPMALPEDSFRVSGGGENLYQFIKTKLKRCIEKTYRTDTTSRTIMGHSLGGYFVLYALLQEVNGNGFFNNYVAASPSIWYHDNYLGRQLRAIQTKKNKKPKLYLTMGEMELAEDPIDGFTNFGQMLSEKDLVDLKIKVYKGTEHMGTAVPTFEDGIEFVFGN